MTSVRKSSQIQTSEVWPDDQVLTEYLLGSLEGDSRQAVETWLCEEPHHGDRLCDLSENLLSISKICESLVIPVGQRMETQATPTLAYRWLATALALAAALLSILFSLDGFRFEDGDETRIALAWAESLPVAGEDLPGWIPESNASDSSLLLEAEDLFVSEDVTDDDPLETDETFGFSSHEPPDWLLAGVQLMETVGSSVEVDEAIQ